MRTWAAAIVAALLPGALHAQDVPRGWPGLAEPGPSTVYVLDDAGVEKSGRVLRLTPEALVLLADDGELRFEAPRVRRIQKRGDSRRNGMLIGAIVGAGIGLVAAGIADCPGDNPGGRCRGFRMGLLLGSTGAYAAIGTGIDTLITGRTTLYDARTMLPSGTAAPPTTAP